MDYSVIGSSSKGNAVVIERNILVDCGLSWHKIAPYVSDIKLVLLTHVHADHFKGSTIRRMFLEKPLIRYGCGSWMVKSLLDAGVNKAQIDVLQPNMMYGYGICNVIPVELYHDVPNFGYKIHYPKGKVFYATDTGSLSGIHAKGYDLYLCEANYEEDELLARMDAKLKEGRYPYEQRAMRYHLSRKQCDDWLYANMGKNSEYVYLHCHVDRSENEGPDN